MIKEDLAITDKTKIFIINERVRVGNISFEELSEFEDYISGDNIILYLKDGGEYNFKVESIERALRQVLFFREIKIIINYLIDNNRFSDIEIIWYNQKYSSFYLAGENESYLLGYTEGILKCRGHTEI